MTSSEATVNCLEVAVLNAAEKKSLQITACKVRMGIIEGVFQAKSGHPGGSLSAADIVTYLYRALNK